MSRSKIHYPTAERRYPADSVEGASCSTSGNSDHEAVLALAVRDLWLGNWTRAEQGFARCLALGVSSTCERVASIVGVAQARLIGRIDARGAFAVLQSLLAVEPLADARTSARLHVVCACLFATPDPGLRDRARSAFHVATARSFLAQEPDRELSALAAIAELGAALLGLDPGLYLETARARADDLAGACSPVTLCLTLESSALVASFRAEERLEEQLLLRALQAAREIGFAASEARLLAQQARRALARGDRAAAAAVLDEASRSLSRASAVGCWLEAALGEARAMLHHSSSASASFGFLSVGLRPGTASFGPPIAQPPPCSADETELEAEIGRLAPSRATVFLVEGSAELRASTARALHDRSGRAQGAFVAVDCSEIEPDAVERTLFGAEYRAGPGGAAREAERGTLYVAAIDQLPPLVQPRFLRFLDEESRVRVVASSQRDLRIGMAQGSFRADLGERLLLVQLVLPKRP